MMTIKVPEKCLVCGSGWSGGHACPGDDMEENLRVFYDCGASMSYWKCEFVNSCYKILFKNCTTEEEKKFKGEKL